MTPRHFVILMNLLSKTNDSQKFRELSVVRIQPARKNSEAAKPADFRAATEYTVR